METSNKNSDNVVDLFPKEEPEVSSAGVTEIQTSMHTLITWAIAEMGINLSDKEIEIALKDPELAEAIDNAILDVIRKIKQSGVLLILAVDPHETDPFSDTGSETDVPNNILDFDASKRKNRAPRAADEENGKPIRFVSQTEKNLIAAKKKVRADKKAQRTAHAKKAWMDAYLLMTGRKEDLSQ